MYYKEQLQIYITTIQLHKDYIQYCIQEESNNKDLQQIIQFHYSKIKEIKDKIIDLKCKSLNKDF